MDDETRRRLETLRRENAFPGLDALYRIARRAGVNATRSQIQRYLASLPGEERPNEVFLGAGHFKGKAFSRGLDAEWKMDTIVYNERSRKGYKYVIFAINPFSREIHAEPLVQLTSETAAGALRAMLRDNRKPEKISTDGGPEFKGAFQELLDREGIDHGTKDPRDKTSYAVMDRAIQTIKVKLAKRGGDWGQGLDPTVERYNDEPHKSTGVAPEDVKDNKVAEFRLQQQNAQAIERNHEVQQKRAEKLQAAGGYREPLPQGRTSFKRAFNPRFGEVKKLIDPPDALAFDYAHAEDGSSVPAKLALASRPVVEAIGPNEQDPLRAAFRPMAEALRLELERRGPMPLVDVSRFVGTIPRFREQLQRAKRKSLPDILRLFRDVFRLEDGVLLLPGQQRPLRPRTQQLQRPPFNVPQSELGWDPYLGAVPEEEDDAELGAALAVALGGARNSFQALRSGSIDLDPEPPRRPPRPPVPAFVPVDARLEPTQPQAFRQPDASQAQGFLGRPDARTEVPSSAASSTSIVEARNPGAPQPDKYWIRLTRQYAGLTAQTVTEDELAFDSIDIQNLFAGDKDLGKRWLRGVKEIVEQSEELPPSDALTARIDAYTNAFTAENVKEPPPRVVIDLDDDKILEADVAQIKEYLAKSKGRRADFNNIVRAPALKQVAARYGEIFKDLLRRLPADQPDVFEYQGGHNGSLVLRSVADVNLLSPEEIEAVRAHFRSNPGPISLETLARYRLAAHSDLRKAEKRTSLAIALTRYAEAHPEQFQLTVESIKDERGKTRKTTQIQLAPAAPPA